MIGKVTVTSDEPTGRDPTLEKTDLRHFLSMLESTGIGFGMRYDHKPSATAVQVEHPHEDSDTAFTVTEWAFDADGKLTGVSMYPGEPG